MGSDGCTDDSQEATPTGAIVLDSESADESTARSNTPVLGNATNAGFENWSGGREHMVIPIARLIPEP